MLVDDIAVVGGTPTVIDAVDDAAAAVCSGANVVMDPIPVVDDSGTSMGGT